MPATPRNRTRSAWRRGVRWGLPAAAVAAAVLATQTGCAVRQRPRKPLPIPQGEVRPLRPAPEPPAVPDGGAVGHLQLRGPDGGWRSVYWEKGSSSVGEPAGGRLEGGRLMAAEGLGWRFKTDLRYGTDETVILLAWAFGEVQVAYPGSVPVVVGDLSAVEGGPLPPHRSHQSGRDADIGYFELHNQAVRGFKSVRGRAFDADKTWYLIERLLLTGQVHYLFVDYDVQEALYQAALSAGWAEADLGDLFQFPRGAGARVGIIRHSPGHDDHFHVRFRCPDGDPRCAG